MILTEALASVDDAHDDNCDDDEEDDDGDDDDGCSHIQPNTCVYLKTPQRSFTD